MAEHLVEIDRKDFPKLQIKRIQKLYRLHDTKKSV